MAKATPAEVKAVANKWLSRPALSLTYVPGERTEGGEARGGAVRADKATAAVAPDRYWNPALGDVGPDTGVGTATAIADRSQLPPVAALKEIDFPAIVRATLKNGMEVVFAQRPAVKTVPVPVSCDAGSAAHPHDTLGPHA